MKPTSPAWLAKAIFYEIYPQTFLDTNGDGIGDLPGVIEKLDYVQSLGCNAIWLNPCFVSPFGDAGYDVADFYKVAPRYGTNADLQRLFAEAHRRGMKVCLDLVAGHTSTDHPWFQASARPEKNKYTNWYVWTDNAWPKPKSNLDTVQGYSDRDGRYITNFFHFQPALNFGFAQPDESWQLPVTHPDVQAVRAEMFKIMRYWLDLGADGFRVDMASSLVKNDPGFVKTMEWWKEVRAFYDRSYPEAVLIAEWSSPSHAIKAGFHIDFLIHFNGLHYTSLLRYERERDVFVQLPKYGHSFFDRKGRGDATLFLKDYQRHLKATRGLGHISLPSGNHDISRLAQGRTVAELEVIFAFLYTQPGVPYLYYGDEIGMDHIHGLTSKEGAYSRTGARTPMQWSGERNAGFSQAEAGKLYIPIDPKPSRPTVAAQERNPKSLLNHVRRLAKLRQSEPALGAEAEFKLLYAKKNQYPLVYLRRDKKSEIIVALNPSAKPCRVVLKRNAVSVEKLLARACALTAIPQGLELSMKGVSYGVFRA